jgi:PAS domain S-box-containing protein
MQSARRESEERLAATYEAATVGIAEADAQGKLLRVNDALCKMLGLPREKLLSMTISDYTHEDEREDDAVAYAKQVAGKIDNYSIRKRARRADGTVLYLDVYSSSVRDVNGHFRYGVRVLQDVTEAKQLHDRVRENERHMRELMEALPAAVYTTDAEGHITFFNKAAVEMAGRTPRLGEQWCVTWKLYTADGIYLPHDQCPMAVALKEDRPVRGVEAIAERPDGTRVPFVPYPTPLHDADGKLVGAINMLVDISHRKEAENRQKVLIDELNHRVKNTLASVQSLASQTIRHSNNLQEFREKFEARVLALARAHDLLSRRYWEPTPLAPLAREVLAPLAGESPDRVQIEGPNIQIGPRAALSLTMAFNELATNAAKYGALSSVAGSLSLSWQTRDEQEGACVLDIVWKERGISKVQVPARRGFGTRLMQRCIEGDLEGRFNLAFEPDGLRCNITIPIPQRAHEL